MRYSKTLLLIAVLGAFSSVSFAQTFKLDEFRQVDERELKTRIYSLFNHLNYNREARGHVIVYAAADGHLSPGETLPLIDRIKQFVTSSPFHDALITVTYGGLRKTEAAEVYIIPDGSVPPVPTWTVGRSGGKTDAVLWSTRTFREEEDELDEFVNRALLRRLAEEEEITYTDPEFESTEYNGPAYTVPNDSYPIADGPEDNSETVPMIKIPMPFNANDQTEVEHPADLSAVDIDTMRFSWADRDYAEAVAKRDGASGVMIFYADDQFYDISRLHAFIEQGRDRITGLAGLDVCQIEVIFGGYRGRAQIEYYIVPEGGKVPEARPEER